MTPYTRNGFKDATKDLYEIDRLWAENPNAAVGVPMGSETSLLTIDIDIARIVLGPCSLARSRTLSGGTIVFRGLAEIH